MIHPIPYRAIVCVKDVKNIIGWEDQAARALLKKIKKQLGKSPEKLVTMQDFCLVTGIPEEVVMKHPIGYRAVVCTKDVMNITGWGDQAARRLLKKIKRQQGKSREKFVTMQDFCQVTEVPEEVVLPFLKY